MKFDKKITSKFPIGKISIGKEIAKKMETDQKFDAFVKDSLIKYSQCEWGDTVETVRKTNDQIVECFVKNNPDLFCHHRVFSNYKYDDDLTITIATHFFGNATIIIPALK